MDVVGRVRPGRPFGEMVLDWLFARSVEHHTYCSLVVVLEHEYHRSIEVRVDEGRCCYEEFSCDGFRHDPENRATYPAR